MPYTIRFVSCRIERDGDEPATPASWTFHKTVKLGLSAGERQAVVSVLQRHSVRRSGHDDRVRVNLRNAGLVDVNFTGLFTNKPCVSGVVSVDELSLAALNFTFELARAGNFMFTPQDVSYPFVISEKLRTEMCISYPKVRSVYAPAVLWKLLRPEPSKEEVSPVAGNESSELPGDQRG